MQITRAVKTCTPFVFTLSSQNFSKRIMKAVTAVAYGTVAFVLATVFLLLSLSPSPSKEHTTELPLALNYHNPSAIARRRFFDTDPSLALLSQQAFVVPEGSRPTFVLRKRVICHQCSEEDAIDAADTSALEAIMTTRAKMTVRLSVFVVGGKCDACATIVSASPELAGSFEVVSAIIPYNAAVVLLSASALVDDHNFNAAATFQSTTRIVVYGTTLVAHPTTSPEGFQRTSSFKGGMGVDVWERK